MSRRKGLFIIFVFFTLILLGAVRVSAEDEGKDSALPNEYGDFVGSLDDSLEEVLPDGIISDSSDDVNAAAGELADPQNVLKMLVGMFGEGIAETIPLLALLIGTVIISTLVCTLSAGGKLSHAVETCSRLATFCVITGTTVSCAQRLSEYFGSLFSAVESFIPLSAALFAMGGNINAAVSSSVSLGTVLAVCQFFCTKTAIPIFCLCVSLSSISAFDTGGVGVGGALSASIRKWYLIALSFVMTVLTVSISASTLIAAKADNMAMRGVKFALGSFVPITGGTLSSTLGTLATSVELLRGSIGAIGVFVLLLILLPCIIELALMRGVFAIAGFCASSLGCPSEARLLTELDSLYGYLEGVAAISAAVFVMILAIFSGIATPFS